MEKDPLDSLREIMAGYKAVHSAGLPRFSGGAVGYVGYDAVRFWEEIEQKNRDDLNLPDCLFMLSHTLIILRYAHLGLPESVLRPHEANPQDPVHYQAPFPIIAQDWTWDKLRVYPSFAGLSLPRGIWDDVGGLDEDYDGAMGFCDLDLGLRLWKKGYNVTQVDGLTVFIDDSETGSHRDRYIHLGDLQHRNGMLFKKKWPDEWQHYIQD